MRGVKVCKANVVNEDERRKLYDAIMLCTPRENPAERKRSGPRLLRDPCGYTPTMGPNMKRETCPVCRTPIEKLSVGGGYVYLCPNCEV